MKRLLSAVLVLVMAFAIIPLGAVTASAETTSGTTGDCTWTLVDGVLTISGEGSIGEHCEDGWWYSFPWETYQREIKKIIIEEGVTRITPVAFWGCSNLMDVYIADSVVRIEEKAFSDCGYNKINLVISKNVSYIDFSAFYDSNFYLTVSDENPFYKSVDGAIFNSDMTEILYFNYKGGGCKQYKIPNGINKIGDYAFARFIGVETVVIPESVTHIGNYAFLDTNMTELVLPESVIAIGEQALDSENIIRITLGSGVESIGYCAFGNTVRPFEVHYNGTKETEENLKSKLAVTGTWHYFGDNQGTICKECGFERMPLGDAVCKVYGKRHYYKDRVKCYETKFLKYKQKWYYVENGICYYQDTLIKDKGKWFGIIDGEWNSSINTLIYYKGKWFYVENGVWQTKATTLVKYKDKWFGVVNGKWNSSAKTLIKYKGKWFYIKNGKWCQDTAIVKYNGKQFYVKKGKVDFDFSGKKKINGKTYKIKNGKAV